MKIIHVDAWNTIVMNYNEIIVTVSHNILTVCCSNILLHENSINKFLWDYNLRVESSVGSTGLKLYAADRLRMFFYHYFIADIYNKKLLYIDNDKLRNNNDLYTPLYGGNNGNNL